MNTIATILAGAALGVLVSIFTLIVIVARNTRHMDDEEDEHDPYNYP